MNYFASHWNLIVLSMHCQLIKLKLACLILPFYCESIFFFPINLTPNFSFLFFQCNKWNSYCFLFGNLLFFLCSCQEARSRLWCLNPLSPQICRHNILTMGGDYQMAPGYMSVGPMAPFYVFPCRRAFHAYCLIAHVTRSTNETQVSNGGNSFLL